MDQSVFGITYVQTRRLTPVENGTRVAIYMSKPLEGASEEIRESLLAAIDACYNGLGPFIKKDIAKGNITMAL